MKNIKILINSLIGVLLFGPKFIFKTCESKKEIMKCEYSCRMIMLIGSIIIISCICEFLINSCEINICLTINTILLLIATILIPKVIIGGCKSEMMRCNSVTFPSVVLISLIGIIVNILIYLFLIKGKKSQNG